MSAVHSEAFRVCAIMKLAFEAQLRGQLLPPAVLAYIDSLVASSRIRLDAEIDAHTVCAGRHIGEILACQALVALGGGGE